MAGGAGNVLNEKLKARVVAGDPPVAVQMFMGPNVWKWGEEGALTNLNHVAEKGNWKHVLSPLITEMVQYKGDYVAVPVNVHRVNWMWANPKIFHQLGIDIPQTWDDFFLAAEIIQGAGYTPLALGGEAWQEATLFEVVLLGIGGSDGESDYYALAFGYAGRSRSEQTRSHREGDTITARGHRSLRSLTCKSDRS